MNLQTQNYNQRLICYFNIFYWILLVNQGKLTFQNSIYWMKILESCKIVFLKAKKCIAFVSVCNAAFQIFGGTTKGGPNI